jgi:hypothetical protein
MGHSPQDAPGIGPGLTHEKGPVGMGEDRPPTWDTSDLLYGPRGAERIGQAAYFEKHSKGPEPRRTPAR